ncbi:MULTISPECIES: helix-turn-helix domain-containing protein [Coprobacillaceae]|uniref:helix-turn-helix domain-containing protein n=1 Tax=Coprobacillaceae TaxID=2810280 RepID=UPI000E4FEEE6|nr:MULTISPECIES: XRE family transcriptional regulator [Coprobacillaceae]RHM62352.1 cupin domain-containing protein [Coprobacillus sp. AF33-1AC]RHS95708.1 cupin domain-containing protein [Erysipelatoclostridium sp. AM42-17]
MDIGKRLKDLRIKNDLTLEELASRSELTKGFLSQVERNLTSPSISTLEDLLEALGTNLAEFFQGDKDEKIVFHTQDFFVNEKDEYTIEWVIPNAQKNEMEPILMTLHSHQKSMEMACHNGQEFGYVLKGQVMLVCGHKKYRLKAKETFYLDGKQSHYLMNTGSNDAKILWITTPPMF